MLIDIRNSFKRLKIFIDHLCLSILPVNLTPAWINLSRGLYASELARMYMKASYWLKINKIEGDVLEFGVGSGASSCLIYFYLSRIYKKLSRCFFLFDSFQGLPICTDQDQHPQWEEGAWSYSQKQVFRRLVQYGVDLTKVSLIPGYYNDSLKPELIEELKLRRAALVHIDCDLFSSTRDALNFLKPLIQDGTVILLDDYFCYSGDTSKGEAGAFHAWCNQNHITATQWHAYAFHGNSFLLTQNSKK